MTKKHHLAIFLLLSIYLFFLIRNMWASDDAFITLRVIRNLFHGYGLRWNGIERVQVFTHPLWLMVLTPFYVLSRNPFFTFYAASFVFSAGAVFFLLSKFSPPSGLLPVVTALLLSSKSFMDYSSSGLENPLLHLTTLLFTWIFLGQEISTKKQIFLLSFIVSFVILNRIDAVLIFLPSFLLILWKSRKTLHTLLGSMVLGFLPIVIWEGFSLLYYGFPFPNTYYAKLTTGIPQAELIHQGWYYIQNSFSWDHITIPVIALLILFLFLHYESKRISLALGIVLYLVYILRIGGDFMSGRFFSNVFVLSIALFLSDPRVQRLKISAASSLAATCLVIVVGFSSYRPPLLIQSTERSGAIDEHGVADEKFIYFKCCSLLGRQTNPQGIKIVEDALQAEKEGTSLVLRESIGIYGYYAGPNVYILDRVCLGDALRARLPVTGDWRIGHFYRGYPVGYIETIENGFVNHIREPHLREYYDKLTLVTRGELFSFERLKTILIFNLGLYDHLIDEYLQTEDWEAP